MGSTTGVDHQTCRDRPNHMLFSEPTTMATDYALAVLCGFFALRLWKVGKRAAQASVCSWAVGFACFGLASFAGGTFHGFSMLISQAVIEELWRVTVEESRSAALPIEERLSNLSFQFHEAEGFHRFNSARRWKINAETYPGQNGRPEIS